nr:hypothetical protein [Fodinibius sp.]NIY28157.1 hypothetical protein [Fodinibius sp.]
MNEMNLGLTNYLAERINKRYLRLTVGMACFVLFFGLAQAQTAENLKETIERHYAAINANDGPTIDSHHLPEM